MTWSSFAARSLNLFIVLPLILKTFNASEISLWYLLWSMIGFQNLGDLGFNVTFTRAVAYSLTDNAYNELQGSSFTTKDVVVVMSKVYKIISVVMLFLALIVGSLLLKKPITFLKNPLDGWISWGIVLIVTNISIYGFKYSAFLQGINWVHLYRRWEALTILAGSISSGIVLLAGGGLIGLVMINQFWVLVDVLRNRMLCNHYKKNIFIIKKSEKPNKELFSQLWNQAWRSGLGVLFSNGILQLFNLAYAQVFSPVILAPYLFGQRVIQQIVGFTRGTFYAKIPALNKMRSENKVKQIIYTSQRTMRLSYILFFAGMLVLLFFGNEILLVIKSNITLPPYLLLYVFGLGYLFERFGAMHIQLYTTTNDVIWHKANGITAIIIICIGIPLLFIGSIYALPIAFLAGNILFYSWYTSSYSYRALKTTFSKYEKYLFMPGMIIYAIMGVIMVITKRINL